MEANCLATWTNTTPGGHRNEDVVVLTGISANAELAAGQRAVTASQLQVNLHAEFQADFPLFWTGNQLLSQDFYSIQCSPISWTC